jgi:hypothetical protein
LIGPYPQDGAEIDSLELRSILRACQPGFHRAAHPDIGHDGGMLFPSIANGHSAHSVVSDPSAMRDRHRGV